jgi:hypothetical protein
MTDASEIRGMVPRILAKRVMYTRRDSPGSCLTAWRWASTPYSWHALVKFAVNFEQSSSQEKIDLGGRFMSQVRGGPDKAT